MSNEAPDDSRNRTQPSEDVAHVTFSSATDVAAINSQFHTHAPHATTAVQVVTPAVCRNYSFFRDVLKEHRKIDDNIFLKLNDMPRGQEDTHMCEQFLESLVNSYRIRARMISVCQKVLDEDVAETAARLKVDPKTYRIQSDLHAAELKQRTARDETEVEDILKDRTLRMFKSRCRSFATGPQFHKFDQPESGSK
ncbi:hypothetical protein RI367_001097 [Sorochytrium milnesiophthora]